MNLPEQIRLFKGLVENSGYAADAFELNVDGDGFRQIFAGGTCRLEVRHRTTDTVVDYTFDGSTTWLESFRNDLNSGRFDG